MNKKEKDTYLNLVYNRCVEILNTVEIQETFERFVGHVEFRGLHCFYNLKVSKEIEDFITYEKINLFEKEIGIKVIDKALRDTAKIIDEECTRIETSIGVLNDKHLSFVFFVEEGKKR